MTILDAKKFTLGKCLLISAALGVITSTPAIENCRQPRFAGKAPEEFYNL